MRQMQIKISCRSEKERLFPAGQSGWGNMPGRKLGIRKYGQSVQRNEVLLWPSSFCSSWPITKPPFIVWWGTS